MSTELSAIRKACLRIPLLRSFIALGLVDSLLNVPLIGSLLGTLAFNYWLRSTGIGNCLQSYYNFSATIAPLPLTVLAVCLTIVGLIFSFFSEEVISKLHSEGKARLVLFKLAAIFEITLFAQTM